MPRFIDCDEHGSQARFLLFKLNPSITHNQVCEDVRMWGGVVPTCHSTLSVLLFCLSSSVCMRFERWGGSARRKHICLPYNREASSLCL